MNKLEEAIRVAFAEQGMYVTAHDVKAAAKACMPFIEKAFNSGFYTIGDTNATNADLLLKKWLKENIGG